MRVEVVEALQKRLQGKAEFVPPDYDRIDLILAVEGCETACVDLSPFKEKPIFVITCPADAERFIEKIFKLA